MTAPIALSCGEPAGIGPEIAVRAWQALKDDCPFLWIGDPAHLPAGTPVRLLDDPAEAAVASTAALPVLAHPFAAPAPPGRPDPRNARGVIEAIERAVALVQSGRASALCTAPIHKKALIDGAGFAYPGHTEFLAALAGVRPGGDDAGQRRSCGWCRRPSTSRSREVPARAHPGPACATRSGSPRRRCARSSASRIRASRWPG